jgi:hypothetical protein
MLRRWEQLLPLAQGLQHERPVQPFLTKIKDGHSVSLGTETRTDRQHIGCVTVVRGNHVLQINEGGVAEARGPMASKESAIVVCLTFDSEDGHRFFRTYEYRLGTVTVTTSEPIPMSRWEDDPELGIEPSRLRAG